MEEEIDDIVGDVKYTDSQKSVTTSNAYSLDFTDSSCSDRNNSSGKDTYVIDCDSDDSTQSFHDVLPNTSVIKLKDKIVTPTITKDFNLQCEQFPMIHKSSTTSKSLHSCAIVSQEIFTQTSKTIMELAEKEMDVHKKSLETQTSYMSITENKTIEYRIHLSGTKTNFSRCESTDKYNCKQHIKPMLCNVTCNRLANFSQDDESSKFARSFTENERSNETKSFCSSDDDIIRIIDEESKEILNAKQNESFDKSTDFEITKSDTDIEEDSLMENEYQLNSLNKTDSNSDIDDGEKSVHNEVSELYTRLAESLSMQASENQEDVEVRKLGTLTPLTEESTIVKESLIDITPDIDPSENTVKAKNFKKPIFSQWKPNDDSLVNNEIKLPPIKYNQSCPGSPQIGLHFPLDSPKKHINRGGLPSYEHDRHRVVDRWEIGMKQLAAGESPLIKGNSSQRPMFLPFIHTEGIVKNSISSKYDLKPVTRSGSSDSTRDPISIKDSIKELKMCTKRKVWTNSRSNSPTSLYSAEDSSKLCDASEKGCEFLCQELLKRLRCASWFEVTDTLDEIPRVMNKFWNVVSETRIADLLRQVCIHADSPRTQVAGAACEALAAILKGTSYTKKPDFFETLTVLLGKTGSPRNKIRSAANKALDDIACSSDTYQIITAICVHGVSHASALVRGASARLLVVSCAMAGCGRAILRSRPTRAAATRQLALRALATLLHDRSAEARKYAERLYAMLRPLPNFDAYYLTDVDVELASKQMKKYDQLLLCGNYEKEQR